MRIVAKSSLEKYWRIHSDAEEPLKAWYAVASKSDWSSPQEVKEALSKARPISSKRVVFEIKGGSYRLIVAFDYVRKAGFIKFFGTHAEYDKIDALTVNRN